MKKFTIITLLIIIIIPISYGKDAVGCEDSCQKDLIRTDRPTSGNSAYDLEDKYYKCFKQCASIGEHVKERIKELAVQPTISSLQKELNACQSQLQIIQEKEPRVYDKLQREFKKIGHSPNYYKGDTDSKAVQK